MFIFEHWSRKCSYSKSKTENCHIWKANSQMFTFEKQNRKCSYSTSKATLINGHWSMAIDQWLLINGHWSMAIDQWLLINGHWSIGRWAIANCQFIIFQEYDILASRIHNPGENALRWLKMEKCFFLKTLSEHGKNQCFRHLGAKTSYQEDQYTIIFHRTDWPELPHRIDFFEKSGISKNQNPEKCRKWAEMGPQKWTRGIFSAGMQEISIRMQWEGSRTPKTL